jgi:hypothetical protein
MTDNVFTATRAKGHPTTAYWNCRLTALEVMLMTFGFGGALLMHLEPVLNSGLAKPFLVLLGVVCMLRPVSGFFFMGASAILPTASAELYARVVAMNEAGEDTGGIIDAGTQYAFISWLVAFVIVYRKFTVKDVLPLAAVVPWIAWMTIANGVGFLGNPDLFKSMAFSMMAAQMAGASEGRYLKCLLGLGFGLLVVSVGFWANAAGLPVQLMNWGGTRGGFERTGSVVVDSVMLWPPILTGIAGLIGVAAFVQTRGNRVDARWTSAVAFGGFFVSLVPLISSMTNSAILGLGVIMAAYAASVFGMGGGRKVKSGSGAGPVLLLVGLGAVAGVVVLTDAFDSRAKLEGLWETYAEQSEELGAAASRNEVWECSLETIGRFPLLGHVFSGEQERIPVQYLDKGYYLSHNVFLDFGRKGGIPAMLLFAYFFLHPVVQSFKTGRVYHYLPFLLAMLAQLIFFTSLSFWTYKPFWALWMLFMVAVGETTGRIAVMKRRRLSRKWQALGFEMPPEGGRPVLTGPGAEAV